MSKNKTGLFRQRSMTMFWDLKILRFVRKETNRISTKLISK